MAKHVKVLKRNYGSCLPINKVKFKGLKAALNLTLLIGRQDS